MSTLLSNEFLARKAHSLTGSDDAQKAHGFEPCPVLPLTEGDVLHQIEGELKIRSDEVG